MAAARLGRSNPSSSRRVGKGAALDSSRVGKIACAPCPRGDDGETRFCPPYSFCESGWIAGSSPAMTRWRHKYLIQIEYCLHNNYAIDYYACLGVKIRILAHSGRVLEAYLNAERGVASRGGDSQPSPREAGAPPRALRPGCEEFAVTDPAARPVRGSAAPAPKIATVRAPGGGRPPYGDARRLARCLACPDSAGPTGASQAPERLSALRHPEIRVGEAKSKTRAQNRAAGTRKAV
jgi:hypothetical protein